MTTPLFRPVAPPDTSWRHFPTRAEAEAFWLEQRPVDKSRLEERPTPPKLRMPVVLPQAFPGALVAFSRVYDALLARVRPEDMVASQKRKKRGKGCVEIPAHVSAAAGDAALSALQLYVASRTRQLLPERRRKWEPFAQGYGCVGLFNGQPLTYDPPEELDVEPRVCVSTPRHAPLGSSPSHQLGLGFDGR